MPGKPAATTVHIAIVGAGIGGLALAIGLLHQNVSFTLYESAAHYSAVGAGVGLGPTALRAMELIDKRFRQLYNQISSGNLTPDKEHIAMEVLYAEDGFGERRGWKPAPFGAECYTRTSAHRRDLLDVMTSLIPRERVRFNKRVLEVVEAGENDTVRITFDDGEVVEADAVIGCDGVKGPTRQAVLAGRYPDQVKAFYSGKYVYRAIIPMENAQEILGDYAGDAKAFVGHKVNIMTFPISRGTELNLVAIKIADSAWIHPQWTNEVTREEMVADFADVVDRRLVRLLHWAKPVQWSLWHHPGTPTYYNGRICLLGDSAHATTPHQASGAGQCLEDALVLSSVLGLARDRAEITNAFKVYDDIRRPRAQAVVTSSQDAGQLYTFTHPHLGEDMDRIVDNLNQRFLWIWEHDLQADVELAHQQFMGLAQMSETTHGPLSL
ncbi:mannitol 1-phosphate dehydrogenase [Aspergillus ellipticus CBS 707.79]|uniref:Mannitol 1-phosphate dehydrogenase n=1 Tax=Aspergillus ellipticus CBS 707.79 TaxID=1448320 RepID=A0A319DNI5_9EURO|nr:mannitol 1-phosphate dehydrogenase [Aspergillus ellipticus CBS 707.79]